ncbi:hypothetical protein C8F04DRAFT_1079875 [Mycena alexandri]|uniref:Uncharacterized protein n=1 Tax=Mycena alexandri TaxID=1745969 RepID=A0AAD6T9I4_9AGAR|nr:hypothetical protein C8F04DRAFT_1079875 [Mycena alexandri]
MLRWLIGTQSFWLLSMATGKILASLVIVGIYCPSCASFAICCHQDCHGGGPPHDASMVQVRVQWTDMAAQARQDG